MAKLIIICGLPGTGKTTLAKKITAKIGGILLRTDTIRKELKEIKYSKKAREGVYGEMFHRTRQLLKEGKNIVLDATFYSRKWRKAAKDIAKSSKANFKIIEVVCPKDLVRKRIAQRKGSESDARFKHYLIYKKVFEPIKEKHLIIDTSKDIKKQLSKNL
jgi:hypothetical protein